MNDNEYKIKYESIEEFRRMASGNIARWEEQLSEIEGSLNRLLNMETFQGESADAIRAYIQEVHITLISAIRQCLREYSIRLLMYQSEYYKIDSDKGACLPEKEISDIGKHLQKQEEFLLERDESIRGILDEISDILPLPVPSQEKLLSDIGEVIKKSNKLNVDVRCYESEKAKEVTEEFTPLTESIKKAIQKYIGQERQLYGYVSGDADKVQEIAELNKKVMQSNWYMIENGADIQAALKEKGEQVEENQPVWYSQKYNAEEPDIHLILDLAGMMPAAGAVFDGINATWYLAEGDYTNAALSGMALIPVIEEFAGAGKAGLKGVKCADNIADAVKALDNTKDVAKAVDDMAGTARCLDDVIESGKYSNATFATEDKLVSHFEKHGNEFKGIYNSADEYLRGARDVMNNGYKVEYSYKGETRVGYVQFIGNNSKGKDKFAFVGTNNEGYITTFHTESGKTFWKLLNGENIPVINPK